MTAQNPLCAAISTKSDEIAYLSAMCAAFVKRVAYTKAVLKVDPEPALRLLADKIAVRAQLKVETAPRFSSQSVGAVGRAQDAVEGKIRCLRLELETRLSIEVTPAMDVWPWLVRHAGWLLERHPVKGNKKTAFEGCFGKPYQGEVMKLAEAAPFRVAVSPTESRQGRADARFVRGIWLGKTTESDERLFANELGVYTTRTVKRVSDTAATCRLNWKTAQDSSRCNARCDTSSGKRKLNVRVKMRKSPAVRRRKDLNPPAVPHVIRVPRAADTEN